MKSSLFKMFFLIFTIIISSTVMHSKDKQLSPSQFRSGRQSAQNSYGTATKNKRRPDGMPYGILNQQEFSRLINDLRFGSLRQKSRAALKFGRARERRAVMHLVHELRDTPPHIQADIVEALGNIRDKRAVPSITLWLKKLKKTYLAKTYSKYNAFMVNAVYALGKIKDNSATKVVADCLHAKYRRIREAAITALILLKDSRGAKYLRLAYHVEKNYHIRKKILKAIKIISTGK